MLYKKNPYWYLSGELQEYHRGITYDEKSLSCVLNMGYDIIPCEPDITEIVNAELAKSILRMKGMI